MNPRLLSAVLPMLALLPCSSGAQQLPAPLSRPKAVYGMAEEDSHGDSRIRRTGAFGSQVPFDKAWSELSPYSRASIRAGYEDMPDDEEPPFPLAGLQSIYKPINALMERYGSLGETQGAWTLVLRVSPSGEGTSFSIIQAPDRDIAMALGSRLVAVRFKPGICKGTPCQMDFPVQFQMEYR